jgi:ribosomal RNA-processing protein 1
MLVRRFVNATFKLLMRTGWAPSACQEYNSILTDTGGPLWYVKIPISNSILLMYGAHSPNDIRVPSSLGFHLADIYLEELNKVLSGDSVPAPLSTLLLPFFHLLARTPTSTTYTHIQTALVNPILAALNPPSQDEVRSRKRPRSEPLHYENVVANACFSDPEREGRVEGTLLRNALLRQIFEVASAPESRDVNRRKMYAVWKEEADEDDAEMS